MKFLSLVFFQGYVWILILPGVLVSFTAILDHRVRCHLPVETLTPVTVVSVALNSQPLPIFYVFLAYDLLGCVIIYFYTLRALQN